MTPERWSKMVADPRWKHVAESQAAAWDTLSALDDMRISPPQQDSYTIVEETFEWRYARELANTIRAEYEHEFAQMSRAVEIIRKQKEKMNELRT